LKGLAYLNKKSITHRNVSKSNILFDIKVKVLFFFSGVTSGVNMNVLYITNLLQNPVDKTSICVLERT
jgi:serine/threonine protein kinase